MALAEGSQTALSLSKIVALPRFGPLDFKILSLKIWAGQPDCSLCSRYARLRMMRRTGRPFLLLTESPRCKKDSKDTHVGPVLPRKPRPEKGLVRRPHVDQHGHSANPRREGKQASLEGSFQIDDGKLNVAVKGQTRRPVFPIKRRARKGIVRGRTRCTIT